jgi:hypothetical protein
MPYVRSRTTKAGTPSTALVDAYRDKEGRPRQRLLASLHGEPTTLRALAKLAALRDDLRKERKKLALEAIDADRFYESVTQSVMHGHQYSETERKEIDRLMRARARLLKRMSKVDRTLAAIQRDGVIIKKHCAASANEIQAAIKAHKREQYDAECLALGMEFHHTAQIREAKAKLRRLMS